MGNAVVMHVAVPKGTVVLRLNLPALSLIHSICSYLLSAVERAGLSLSTVERLGLLSKAEELGVLSGTTDPGTPGTLQGLALVLQIGRAS